METNSTYNHKRSQAAHPCHCCGNVGETIIEKRDRIIGGRGNKDFGPLLAAMMSGEWTGKDAARLNADVLRMIMAGPVYASASGLSEDEVSIEIRPDGTVFWNTRKP